MYKKIRNNEYFKKSIESTVKAISEKKNLNIFFGETDKTKNKDIVLPPIASSAETKKIKIIRGMSDSASLIKKFHNEKLHRKFCPSEENQKKIFNELENLRCEILGSKKMPGIKKNITDYFEINILEETKETKKISKEKTLKFLLRDLLLKDNLSVKYKRKFDSIFKKADFFIKNYEENISNLLTNQEKFGKFINKLLETIFIKKNKSNQEETPDDSSEENSLDNDSKKKEEEEQKPNPQFLSDDLLEQDENDYINQSDVSDLNESNEGDSNIEFASKNEALSSTKESFKYSVYTSEFDSIINAGKLCDINEIIKLRKQLDKQTDKLDSTITILANKLQRKLLAKQKRWWEFDLEEGVLDSGKLARVVVSPENSLSYKKEAEADFKDTIVTLLIDNSGSMRGRPISIAAISADILAKTL